MGPSCDLSLPGEELGESVYASLRGSKKADTVPSVSDVNVAPLSLEQAEPANLVLSRKPA